MENALDTFGADTKLNGIERTIAEAVVSGKRVMFPTFVDGHVHIDYHSENPTFNNEYSGNPALSFFEGCTIIPFDFTRCPKKEEAEYFTSDKKIARPDFFAAKELDGRIHLYPVDVKEKEVGNDNIKQTSMMNTAMLYHHSKHMKAIVEKLNAEYEGGVVFENGFFLSSENEENKSEGLEEYIRANLPKRINERDIDLDNNGIIIEDCEPELVNGTKVLFGTSRDYKVSDISARKKLINHMGHVKERIEGNVVYPNKVYVIEGFNGGWRPVYRLKYDPLGEIQSSDNHFDIERLEDLLVETTRMSFEERAEILRKANNIDNEDVKILKRLTDELMAKEIEESFIMKNRDDDFLVITSTFECEVDEKKLDEHAKNIEKIERDIRIKKQQIEKMRRKMIEKHNKRYEYLKMEAGSQEWYDESRRLKIEDIEAHKKNIQKLKDEANKWGKGDIKKNKLLKNFRRNPNFTLAENPTFPMPTELYMHFKTDDIKKVLLFNSVSLK